MIRPVEAKFIISAPSIKEAPPPSLSEVAFIGRSNVGKSSLINALVERKGLAKSSSTPGKTKLLNFFDVVFKVEDEKFPVRFVDLPGYGYAKTSKSLKSEWQKSLTQFLAKRDAIRVFVHLIDARHPELPIDKNTKAFLESIKRRDQIILSVYTKADKLKQKERSKIKRLDPNALLVSSIDKKGIDLLRQKILEHLFGKDSITKADSH